MHYFCFLILSLFVFSCSSSDKNEVPDNFKVSYYTMSGLMRYELKIQVTDEKLSLNYENKMKGNSDVKTYVITQNESEKLYNYIKQSGIISMKTDNTGYRADSPMQNITVSYGSKTNSLDFGNMENPPPTLVKLKEMIFDLTSRYNKEWKTKMDF